MAHSSSVTNARSHKSSGSSCFQAPKNRLVVWVDPEDDASWWWPAMVVTPEELQVFRDCVDNDVDVPNQNDYLVCYFEDGSYNVVPKSATKPFIPSQEPYTSWISGPSSSQFTSDHSVSLATRYYDTGIVPSCFSWLKHLPKPDSKSDPTISENDKVEKRAKSPVKEEKRKKSNSSSGAAVSVSSIGTSERKASLSSLAMMKREAAAAALNFQESSEPAAKKMKRGSISSRVTKQPIKTNSNGRTTSLNPKSPGRNDSTKSHLKSVSPTPDSLTNDTPQPPPPRTSGRSGKSSASAPCSKCGTLQPISGRMNSNLIAQMESVGGGLVAKFLCNECCELLDCILPMSRGKVNAVQQQQQQAVVQTPVKFEALKDVFPSQKKKRILQKYHEMQKQTIPPRMTDYTEMAFAAASAAFQFGKPIIGASASSSTATSITNSTSPLQTQFFPRVLHPYPYPPPFLMPTPTVGHPFLGVTSQGQVGQVVTQQSVASSSNGVSGSGVGGTSGGSGGVSGKEGVLKGLSSSGVGDVSESVVVSVPQISC